VAQLDLAEQPAGLPAADRDLAVRRARALSGCSIPGGTFDKGFIGRTTLRAEEDPAKLSVKQAEWLARLAWKYRRQMPASLIPPVKPG